MRTRLASLCLVATLGGALLLSPATSLAQGRKAAAGKNNKNAKGQDGRRQRQERRSTSTKAPRISRWSRGR